MVTMPYTHTGYERAVGYIHGPRLYGHKDYSGKTHALNGGANIYSGAVYKALCGKTVRADHDGYGFNVVAGGENISCKRCRAIVVKQRLASKE